MSDINALLDDEPDILVGMFRWTVQQPRHPQRIDLAPRHFLRFIGDQRSLPHLRVEIDGVTGVPFRGVPVTCAFPEEMGDVERARIGEVLSLAALEPRGPLGEAGDAQP